MNKSNVMFVNEIFFSKNEILNTKSKSEIY